MKKYLVTFKDAQNVVFQEYKTEIEYLILLKADRVISKRLISQSELLGLQCYKLSILNA